MMSFFLNFLQWIFYLVFWLPPPAALYLMYRAGGITYQTARLTRIKNVVAGDIRLLFPAADAKPLADKLLKNIGYSIFEVLCTPFFKAAHLDRIARIAGLENIDLALAKRKGAILIAMHAGNYELIPTALAGRGYHLTSILKAPPRDPLFAIVNRSRSYRGTKLINVLEDNMYQEAIRALSHDRCVFILIDTGALESRHEIISFLGKKVPIATGWLTLAQRSGAPVIPCLSKREGEKLMITCGEPLTVHLENKKEVIETIRKFYENFIRSNPEQWAIFLNEYETKRMARG